jgi:serine/threonine-protein kinase HipA
VADQLVVWLYGTPVAVLTPASEFRIRLKWHAEGIARWGLGSPALSVGLPVGTSTSARDMRGLDFFENMLPEGPALARMAILAGVRPVDTYGILAAFGRDCAGAVMLLPDREQPGTEESSGYSPITSADLQRVIGELDAAPLGAAPERGYRPSLPGFQRKVLLGRAVDGPGSSLMVTLPRPGSSNLMGRTRWLRTRPPACGLPRRAHSKQQRPNCSTSDCLCSRSGATTGASLRPECSRSGCIRRTAARSPGMKYEEQGGPSLHDLADLLRNYGDPAEVTQLLHRTTFNMAVGNADAHAKNFSVLHDADNPAISLAPLYDVVSTIALELTDGAGLPMRADPYLGQRVGGQTDIRKVTAASLIDEASAWGVRRRTAASVVSETLDHVLTAIPETPGDERVLAVIRRQAERVKRNQC